MSPTHGVETVTENIFAADSVVLALLSADEWQRLWPLADMDDMVRVLRVLDDHVRHEALANMPEGLPEPDMPERLTVEEVRDALARVVTVAEGIMFEKPAGAPD